MWTSITITGYQINIVQDITVFAFITDHKRVHFMKLILPCSNTFDRLMIMMGQMAKIFNQVKIAWWSHQIETFSALLAICAGNSPVSGEFPSQRPVTRSFDVLFDLRLNKRLSKQSWCWWFETPSCPLWHHCNGWFLSEHGLIVSLMLHYV